MKNLKVWQKLVAMGIVFIVPFAVVTWKMTSVVNEHGVEFTTQELRGLDYYASLLPLFRDLQQRRGMAVATLSGDGGYRAL